jgi:hypothetical protein
LEENSRSTGSGAPLWGIGGTMGGELGRLHSGPVSDIIENRRQK